ncbi:hypothetical protein HWV62_9946 [Athelia sp. TMB]|nr:hypothetical protein HWV62_9946 [Athelia sp. TMB]
MLNSVSETSLHSGPRTLGLLPWTQLSAYRANHLFSHQQCLDLLGQMPNIITFYAMLEDPTPQLSRRSPSRCPKLKKLDLWSNYKLSHFLNYLELPSLTELSIDECGRSAENSSEWEPSLLSLIHRSSRVLKTLVLKVQSANDQSNIAGLLKATPRLEIFQFEMRSANADSSWSSERVVQALAAPSACRSRPHLVPELQFLTLMCDRSLLVHSFMDMIESRWQMPSIETPESHVTRIKSISLHRIPALLFEDQESLNRVEQLACEGLEIKFVKLPPDW